MQTITRLLSSHTFSIEPWDDLPDRRFRNCMQPLTTIERERKSTLFAVCPQSLCLSINSVCTSRKETAACYLDARPFFRFSRPGGLSVHAIDVLKIGISVDRFPRSRESMRAFHYLKGQCDMHRTTASKFGSTASRGIEVECAAQGPAA
ncbi:uncharacterized protein RCC_02383 [Ramularia collo-cygni]|uniref:Uncharacterized protein n=1 Tax=Ramularia collo-cygni TaxID=112498 RepID=A0A2D3V4Y6_9PEZI|nr:uncharacterized protein RCC_02383 [Ramularia collo-cygni]CZT16549.1 uncharacterized protein RCC_02383 [Ramularia collo-cygni]